MRCRLEEERSTPASFAAGPRGIGWYRGIHDDRYVLRSGIIRSIRIRSDREATLLSRIGAQHPHRLDYTGRPPLSRDTSRERLLPLRTAQMAIGAAVYFRDLSRDGHLSVVRPIGGCDFNEVDSRRKVAHPPENGMQTGLLDFVC